MLTKSSMGAGGLGDRAIKDDGDTCRDSRGGVADTHFSSEVWWLHPQNHEMVWWFGPQNHRMMVC